MAGNAFEGEYDLTAEELEGLGDPTDSAPEDSIPPNESDADVNDQDDSGESTEPDNKSDEHTSVEADDEKGEAENAKPGDSQKPEKVNWREVLGRDDIDWDGFVKAKLEELPPDVAQQRQYLSRLAAEYQRKMEELGSQAKQTAEPEETEKDQAVKEPPIPSFGDDEATFQAKQQAREEWLKQEAVRAANANASELSDRLNKMEQKVEQREQERHMADIESRLAYVKSLPEYTPEVEKQLDVMVDQFPHMAEMATTDEGAQYLVKLAAMAVAERRSKVQKVDHEATARERVVPRAVATTSAKSAKDNISGDTPLEWVTSLAGSDEFAGLFDD